MDSAYCALHQTRCYLEASYSAAADAVVGLGLSVATFALISGVGEEFALQLDGATRKVLMAKCLKADCDLEALEESAYCSRHQPRLFVESGLHEGARVGVEEKHSATINMARDDEKDAAEAASEEMAKADALSEESQESELSTLFGSDCAEVNDSTTDVITEERDAEVEDKDAGLFG